MTRRKAITVLTGLSAVGPVAAAPKKKPYSTPQLFNLSLLPPPLCDAGGELTREALARWHRDIELDRLLRCSH